MTAYNKKFLTFEEQRSLLKERGLIIKNEEKLFSILKHVSYYHLSIYCKAFQDSNDKFKEGTTLQNIWDLYNFDKKLRLLLLDVLERIEMSLKCVLIYEISKDKKDNYWYTDKSNFKENEDVKKFLDKIKDSKEIYIQHYYRKYNFPDYPPSWIFFESLSFGECARLIRNLHENDRQIIAESYKMSKAVIQMFHYLSNLRNFCAHHSRVWNRGFPMKISSYKKYKEIFNEVRKDSLFAYIAIIQILLKKINPESICLEKLESLILEYKIEIYRMGFPNDWKDRLKKIV